MKRFLLLACLLLTVTDALALRCGRQLVQVGDHQLEVLDKCGEPDWTEQRVAVRGNRLRHPDGVLEESRYVEVVIDEWLYDFGPRKFKQLLQFENGVLKEIKNLDYGH